MTFILKLAGGASRSQTDILYGKVNLSKGPFSLPDSWTPFIFRAVAAALRRKNKLRSSCLYTFCSESPLKKKKSDKRKRPDFAIKVQTLIFFSASDYTLSGGKASTASVTCISNPRNAPSFSDRLSSLPNCLREAETRGWEVEGWGKG